MRDMAIVPDSIPDIHPQPRSAQTLILEVAKMREGSAALDNGYLHALIDDMANTLKTQAHCLTVLDVTIYCIAPLMRPELAELFKGQIACAKEAYEHATGEESMIGSKRERG